jgi:hypothetical protein
VVFSCESKISKNSLNGRIWCWTHDPKEPSEQNIIQIIRDGGGSMMI